MLPVLRDLLSLARAINTHCLSYAHDVYLQDYTQVSDGVVYHLSASDKYNQQHDLSLYHAIINSADFPEFPRWQAHLHHNLIKSIYNCIMI